ncbi:MAG TPA: hypothetical protein VL354_04980 [Spirochaetia bacterium]|nr:hypothetical protein [Spirochaetia bacterium]
MTLVLDIRTLSVAIGWVVVSSTTFVVAMTRELQQELSDAQREVQVLSDLLPICANCKRIRDEDGSWIWKT